jgi:predicted DNA-binding protein (MmcQ/YjbR family)
LYLLIHFIRVSDIREITMNIESLRSYALQLPDVEETLPFGPDNLVFKVKGKMFFLLPLDTTPLHFNVKCNPEDAIELREQYPSSILPGYHMNKKHWNTVIVDGTLTTQQLLQFIKNSYHLVAGINKKKQ